MNRQTIPAVIRAAAILTSGFVAATDFPVPANCGRATLHLNYTRNGASTTGFPEIKIQWKSNSLTLDGNKLSETTGNLITPETYQVGPSAATIIVAIPILVPDGVKTLSVSIKEAGDIANLGTAQLLAAIGEIEE